MECYICKQPITSTKLFFYHLRLFHNISTKSKDIQCAYSGCPITLNSTRGIKDHMNRCHSDFEQNAKVDPVSNVEQVLSNENEADFEKYVGSFPHSHIPAMILQTIVMYP